MVFEILIDGNPRQLVGEPNLLGRLHRGWLIEGCDGQLDGVRRGIMLVGQLRSAFSAEAPPDVDGGRVLARTARQQGELCARNDEPSDSRRSARAAAALAMTNANERRPAVDAIANRAAQATTFDRSSHHNFPQDDVLSRYLSIRYLVVHISLGL